MRCLLTILVGFSSWPALALCSTASLDDDYRQADVVVRAIVIAETVAADDEPSVGYVRRWGNFSPVSLHRLRVVEVFKGRPGPSINVFQEVNSARFPFDLDDDLLVYLSYHQPSPSRPTAANGAMYVRYTCGQSQDWDSATAAEIGRLRALRAR